MLFDLLKHLTTLCTATLLVMIAMIQYLSVNLTSGTPLIVGAISLLACMVTSVIAMFVIPSALMPSKIKFGELHVLASFFVASIAFYIIGIALIVYSFFNL